MNKIALHRGSGVGTAPYDGVPGTDVKGVGRPAPYYGYGYGHPGYYGGYAGYAGYGGYGPGYGPGYYGAPLGYYH